MGRSAASSEKPKRKKRGHRKSSKGASFEREFCKQLGLWYSGDQRDDIFWRTAGSGAMATSRRKRGRGAYGQHGDVQAVDPVGEPLLRKLSIELKRGYSAAINPLHFFAEDRANILAEFRKQARREAKEAGKPFCWVVVRADRMPTFLLCTRKLYLRMLHKSGPAGTMIPTLVIENNKTPPLVMCPLDTFLDVISPLLLVKNLNDYEPDCP